MDLLIKNGRIIDPCNRVDSIGDILVSDGIIKDSGHRLEIRSRDCSVFDATNMIVCPGFIDLHCHLREPGFEHKETIASGTSAAAAGGFTTVCCMPNTNPCIDTVSVLEHVQRLIDETGKVRVLPISAITINQLGENLTDMGVLVKTGAVAFSDDGKPIMASDIMRQALQQSKTLNVPVIEHCEDIRLSSGGHMNAGEIARRMAIPGIPAEAEERMVERDIGLAGETGGWVHIAHVSTAGSVEMIRRAKRQGMRITSEVTPHHLTLTEEAIITGGTNAKVNPPLRTEHDRLALIEGLVDGTIDAIATDHAPHSLADKQCDFQQAAFGISGFETALGSLMALVHQSLIDITLLISKLTCEPATILGRQSIGNLRSGSQADMTIIDPVLQWTVDSDKFFSKGKNTPLEGQTFKGKVIKTIVGGETVYGN